MYPDNNSIILKKNQDILMLDYISNYTTHKLKIIIHEHFVFEIFSSGEVKKSE